MLLLEFVHNHSQWYFLVVHMPSNNLPCLVCMSESCVASQHVHYHLSNLQKASDKAAVDHIFKELDKNQDNSVDFEEFGRMVFCLTVMCHEYFTAKK